MGDPLEVIIFCCWTVDPFFHFP